MLLIYCLDHNEASECFLWRLIARRIFHSDNYAAQNIFSHLLEILLWLEKEHNKVKVWCVWAANSFQELTLMLRLFCLFTQQHFKVINKLDWRFHFSVSRRHKTDPCSPSHLPSWKCNNRKELSNNEKGKVGAFSHFHLRSRYLADLRGSPSSPTAGFSGICIKSHFTVHTTKREEKKLLRLFSSFPRCQKTKAKILLGRLWKSKLNRVRKGSQKVFTVSKEFPIFQQLKPESRFWLFSGNRMKFKYFPFDLTGSELRNFFLKWV